MRKVPSNLLHVLLAMVLLVLQWAGSSPQLHGVLHGELDVNQTCSHQDGSCERTPADEDPEPCSDACAVLILRGGLALTQAVTLDPVTHRFIGVHGDGNFTRCWSGSQKTTEARAPPVL